MLLTQERQCDNLSFAKSANFSHVEDYKPCILHEMPAFSLAAASCTVAEEARVPPGIVNSHKQGAAA